MEAEKLTGTVKWFNERKGFGFIEVPGDKDYFIHYTNIVCDADFKTLEPGQRVKFTESVDADGRPRAMELEVIND